MNFLKSRRNWLVGLFAAVLSVQTYDQKHEQDFYISRVPGAYAQEYMSLENVAKIYGKVFEGSEVLGYVKVHASHEDVKKLGTMPGFTIEPITYYGIPKQPDPVGLFACAPKMPEAQPPPSPQLPPPPTHSTQKTDWGVALVHAPEAQVLGDAHDVKVCVVDTGVDLNHPDLKGRIIAYKNFTGGDPSDVHDAVGHGDHTIGLVGAINNGYGVWGASQAQLMMAKVLDDSGSGQMNWIADGVVWCVQMGANIISESLGGRGFSQILYNAHLYASQNGVAVFAAAGNDNSPQVGCPACFKIPGLYSVGALDKNKQRAVFSNYGKIEMWAPGVDILSTLPGGRYGVMSGTSMATPIAAGVGALYLSAEKQMQLSPLPTLQPGMIDAIFLTEP